MCANEVDLKRSNALKKYLDDYFDEADEEKDGLVNLSVEEVGRIKVNCLLWVHDGCMAAYMRYTVRCGVAM